MAAVPRDLLTVALSSRGRLERSIAHLPASVDPSRAVEAVLVELDNARQPGHLHRMHRVEMIARIAKDLGTTPAFAEAIAAKVLAALRDELPESIVQSVASELPHDIEDLLLSGEPFSRRDTPVIASGVRATLEREIEERVDLPPDVAPSAAFTAVMSALLERLTGGEALDVLIGLPDELRPLLEGPALDRPERARTFHRDELFTLVAERLHVARDLAADLVSVVFGAVKHLLPRKEIEDVAVQLPADLRTLWVAA